MAAPHVAGACALVWSRNTALSYLEVKDIVLGTADTLVSLEDLCVTEGRLNLYNAVVDAGALDIDVDDGVGEGGCAVPDESITYTISYSNAVVDTEALGYLGDVNDIVIVDYLPEGVDFDFVDPNVGTYDKYARSYTWEIAGLLRPGDSNSVEINVTINEFADPLTEIVNRVEITSDVVNTVASGSTFICCWGEKVIYVDGDLSLSDPNGSSWATAYDDLQEALGAANICDEIWVAGSSPTPITYIPAAPSDPNATFNVGNGIKLYGGYDSATGERDWEANAAVLSGDIAGDDCLYVVTNANTVDTVIEGFTIKDGATAGFYCNNVSTLIEHNRITGNGTGVYSVADGGSVVRNNFVYENGYGIYFEDPLYNPEVRNNTVADNSVAGIQQDGGEGGNVDVIPTSCILWGHPATYDLVDCNSVYSCIEDGDGGVGNIDTNPNFVDAGIDDYHLDPGSPCVDGGDPGFCVVGEFDIDGDVRSVSVVDIGADEVVYVPECWVYAKHCFGDADGDGAVGLVDFNILKAAWSTTYSTDPNSDYDACADFDEDGSVGLVDFNIMKANWGTSPTGYCSGCGLVWPPEVGESASSGGGGGSAAMSMSGSTMSIAEQIAALEDMIAWVDDLWLDKNMRENLSRRELNEFIAEIEAMIAELEGGL